ncbi:hypothetical protein KKG71_02010 [Patescibacteria group bacterium]|nr:hypothetical protein [Patescibacteria group bacterium]
MQKKLTITIDEDVYNGLHKNLGRGKISTFISTIVRPYVIENDLKKEYQEMARDKKQENEAIEWSENCLTDIYDEN